MFAESSLQINHCHLPPFSVRNCQQKLTSFNPAGMRCTVNGKWIPLDPNQSLKYKTVISGQDCSSPGLHHLKIGDQITVHCIQVFTQQVYEDKIELLRPPVQGSIKVYTETLHDLPFLHSEQFVTVQSLLSKQCFVSYRPLMTMTVMAFDMHFQEWDDQNQWTLTATE